MKNIIQLLVLILISLEAFGGAGIFPQGDHMKAIKEKLEFKSGQQVISADSDDPTSVAKDAPVGSLYLRTNGIPYIKQDAGSSTNWDTILNGVFASMSTGQVAQWDGTNWINTEQDASYIDYDASHSVKLFFDHTANCGITEQIVITDEGGTDFSWTSGEIYDCNANEIVTVSSGSDSCISDNSLTFINWISGSTLTVAATKADEEAGEVAMGHLHCSTGDIEGSAHSEQSISERVSAIAAGLADNYPVLVKSGLAVSEHAGANAFDLDSTAGKYWHDLRHSHSPGALDSTVTPIERYYHSGGVWASDTNSQIDNTQWDNGTGLVANSVNIYYRHLILIKDGGADAMIAVYPDTEYGNVTACLNGVNPTIPPGLVHFPAVMAICLKGNDSSLPISTSDQWLDQRRFEDAFVSSGAITNHGNLSGLTDDDHTQYVLLAGRSGGQTFIGDSDADGTMTLQGAASGSGEVLVNGGFVAQATDNAGATDAQEWEDSDGAQVAAINSNGLLDLFGGVYLASGDINAAGSFDIKRAGVDYMTFQGSQIIVTRPMQFPNGILSKVAVSFQSSPNSGWDRTSAKDDVIGVSNGVSIISIDDWGIDHYFPSYGPLYLDSKISNSHMEENITDGWATYDDGAVDKPVDGTGGTASNVTNTRNSGTFLYGVASLDIEKAAADAQGEGASYDFSIYPGEQSKMLKIRYMKSTTANYADDMIRMFVYDVTNTKVISVTDPTVYAGSDDFVSTFETSPDSLSYRLIFHVVGTEATAWDLKVDNIEINRDQPVYSQYTAPVETIKYTGYTSTHASANIKFKTSGVDTSDTYMSVTNGDYTKITFLKAVDFVATTNTLSASGALGGYLKRWNSSDVLQAEGVGNSSTTYHNGALSGRAAVGDYITSATNLTITDSASGTWLSVSVYPSATLALQSSDATQRGIWSEYTGNGTEVITASTTDITFDTKVEDKNTAWDGDQYTVEFTGSYKFSGMIYSDSVQVGVDLYVSENGGAAALRKRIGLDAAATTQHPFMGEASLNAGDVVSVRSSAGITLVDSATLHHIMVSKVGDPTTISATTPIEARYVSDAGQTINNTTTETILYEDVDFDSFGSYDTGTGIFTFEKKATCVTAAKSRLDAGGGWASGEQVEFYIYKNGTVEETTLNIQTAAHALNVQSAVDGILSFEKSDTMSIRVWQNSGGNIDLNTSDTSNTLALKCGSF